jgi:adenosylmethionine-8-amino-7-oxononanoate aminotransferase
VVELSERLSALTGGALGHCFYASDGASATEIALKMSFHSWRNRGADKKQDFLCLEGSYHGETVGALAVTDVAIFKDAYAPLIRAAAPCRRPTHARPKTAKRRRRRPPRRRRARKPSRAASRTHRRADRRTADPVRQRHGHVRPGIPAPGARALRPLRGAPDLRRDRRRLRPHRHLLRPRAGGIKPDFLCLSKGISGGYLPLSIVLTTDAVYGAFYDDATARGFLHSHSYTGNALACRAALATLDIFAEDR